MGVGTAIKESYHYSLRRITGKDAAGCTAPGTAEPWGPGAQLSHHTAPQPWIFRESWAAERLHATAELFSPLCLQMLSAQSPMGSLITCLYFPSWKSFGFSTCFSWGRNLPVSLSNACPRAPKALQFRFPCFFVQGLRRGQSEVDFFYYTLIWFEIPYI